MLYNDTLPTSIEAYTDGSTIPNPGPSGYGFYAIDDTKIVYHGYGSAGINATNNIAELTAVIKFLRFIKTIPSIETITINSDSKYVVDNIQFISKWESKNWESSTGELIKNIVLWQQLQEELKYLNNKKISFKWVRGHSGILGNETADINANKGRIALMHGDINDIVITENSVHPIEEESIIKEGNKTKPEKKVKKKAIIPLNPLFTGKRWFFISNKPIQLSDGRFFYLSSTYKEDAKKPNQNLGKRSPDTSYSILLTKNNISELDSLRDKYNINFSNMHLPVIGDMATITKASNWTTIVESQNALTVIKGELAVMPDSTVLAYIVNPPKLVFRLEDIYNYGFTLLSKFENKDPNIVFIDITDNILTKVKDKQTINSNFILGMNSYTIPDVVISDILISDVKLQIGVDLPVRNTFTGLLKQTKEPIKVTLAIFEITGNSFRIVTIIENEDNLGIYYSPDSNYRLVSNNK